MQHKATHNFETVWSDYRQQVNAFLHSKITRHCDVDDVLQEVMIKSFAHFSTVESVASIKAWLFQIARHAVIDFYRKENLNNKRYEPLVDPDLAIFEEQKSETLAALSQCIEPFIRALPDHSATLLRHIDLNGQSQKSYANEHHIVYSTLKSQVKKSRNELKSLFEQCCQFNLDAQGNISEISHSASDCNNC